ncbi:iron-containing alcohol dehydrogenase [Bacteroides cellulosilyticus]|uniref:iron-containing alcohol dehydrogenase n=1 Tax=Bacteroides cellulosilyticus TaxID=246787 RepID=UPI00234DE053|nr:iron-containing alcohol dehydrogenase [Bacteroides cellulosilyticus]MDC7176826.1 iron-containing alcohol dehydrogenase [Bacteroides cellulosilyticus]MDC7180035.1 iron-containing alcohol dehydrogenase [Bacteroides cellulosilyticus]
MNNFVFYSPTEFVFGKATEMQVGALARKHGARKVMIVYGGGSVVRSGLLDRVKQSLQEAGIEYCLMGGVQPNPVDTKVYEGIEFCRREQADMLLPVGGGSVIDTAKAIAAGVLYEGDFWDFYIGKAKVTKALKVAVVLTIPAAGSEGSGNTVITKLDGLQKLSLRVPEVLRPVFSIMNPELTYTLPPFQTACGVADMMAHIMERYFTNTQEVEIGDRLCEGTLMAIINEAPKVMRNPEDYGARANLMWAGMIAHNGTCGVGCEEDWASHFLEHEISAIYGVTHGAGLSVIFPAWMTWMVEHNVGKIAQYAVRVWGVPESEDKKAVALEGIGKLKTFFTSLGLPVTFKELGVENPDIDRLADSLHRNKGELVGNYVKLTKLDSKEIYRLACAGE